MQGFCNALNANMKILLRIRIKKNSIQNLSEMLIESHIFYLLLVKSSVVQVAKMKGKETQDTLSFNILALKYN